MQKARVLVASEDTPVRRLLAEVVRGEPGATVAGEAGSAIEATALARQLRPDIALLDLRLPYSVGLDSVRLSRISGLDAALAILAELPSVRAVLLSNLETAISPEKGPGRAAAIAISAEGGSVKRLLTLRELYLETVPLSVPLFASIALREGEVKRGRARKMLYGLVASVLGAWLLAGLVFLVFFLVAIIGG